MSNGTVEVYRDKAGEYRWRAKANNHETVADSGEGYEHKSDCVAMAELEANGTDRTLVILDPDLP